MSYLKYNFIKNINMAVISIIKKMEWKQTENISQIDTVQNSV